ncbi:hypothetical protein KOW79_017328 [Hemibagrus wyckioides]|uniref:Uncharacterized protein n=1 Tax=Hemibagrus wyckioides TaxID=337641 RepID=A0A9D3NCE0_9TELE|nr:hypothetical protein KOW79_017328 [Hemibagrus wyckioides]
MEPANKAAAVQVAALTPATSAQISENDTPLSLPPSLRKQDSGGVDSCEVREVQVGNASVYLRLLLRPPRPLPAEKEEKEETRGAAAGLRDRGLTIWDCKYTRVYAEKIFVSPQQTSGLILRDYFSPVRAVPKTAKEGNWSQDASELSLCLSQAHLIANLGESSCIKH